MLILAIDTSNRAGSVALLRDDAVVAEVAGHDEAPYSNRLFGDVQALRSKAPFQISEIDVFAVASGPGSFTGLRIGLTAVKAWSEVYGKPIAAVSVLGAIAAEHAATGRSEAHSGMIAPFVDARRGQLYSALYRPTSGNSRHLELIGDELILSPNEYLRLVSQSSLSGQAVLVSPAPNLLPAELLTQSLPGFRVETVSGVLAPMIGRLGFEQAKRGCLVDALHLDANYVRRNDAESKWKDP